MKKITWNLHAIWDAIKLVVTRNLWLKIVAFLLAFATYSALKEKTKDRCYLFFSTPFIIFVYQVFGRAFSKSKSGLRFIL